MNLGLHRHKVRHRNKAEILLAESCSMKQCNCQVVGTKGQIFTPANIVKFIFVYHTRFPWNQLSMKKLLMI